MPWGSEYQGVVGCRGEGAMLFLQRLFRKVDAGAICCSTDTHALEGVFISLMFCIQYNV